MYEITKVIQGIPFLLNTNSLAGAGQARVSLREIARLINQEDLRVLKRLVERNSKELAELGDIVSLATMAAGNSSRYSAVEDVLLNTEQALYLVSRTDTPMGRRLCVLMSRAFAEMLRGYAWAHATGAISTQSKNGMRDLPKLDVVSPSEVLLQQAKSNYLQALKLQDYEKLLGDLDSRVLALELHKLPTASIGDKPSAQSHTVAATELDADPNTDPELNTFPVPVATKDIPAAIRATTKIPSPQNTAAPLSATHYTVRGFAQVNKLKLSDGQAQGLGRRATALCKKKKLKKHKVRDKRWGEVGYYPAIIVKSVFADWYAVEDP